MKKIMYETTNMKDELNLIKTKGCNTPTMLEIYTTYINRFQKITNHCKSILIRLIF
jgi:hypothetical protein